MARLHPCPSCARHVRETDDRCPFCAAVAVPPPATPRSTRKTVRGVTRAALLFGSVSIGATACGAATEPHVPDSGTEPVPPAADASATTSDAGDDIAVVPHYGAPGP